MSKVLFAKITKERRKQFQIITRIEQEDGVRYATKEALYEEGQKHISRMKEYASLYELDNIQCVSCEMRGKKAYFPYIEGETLSDVLLEAVSQKDKKQVYNILTEYHDFIYQMGKDKQEFVANESFKQVFGEVDNLKAVSGCFVNIDNILENIIQTKDGYKLIDYEWFFEFPIPFDFVIYRAVLDLYVNYAEVVSKMFAFEELLSFFSITSEQAAIYEHMNESFNHYVFNDKDGYQKILKKYKKNQLCFDTYIDNHKVYAQLYYDDGSGFSEENSLIQELSVLSYNNCQLCEVEFVLPQNKTITMVRFDPLNVRGEAEFWEVAVYDKNQQKIAVDRVGGNINMDDLESPMFLPEDSQILWKTKENIARIVVKMKIAPCVENSFVQYCNEIESSFIHYRNKMENYATRLKNNNIELVRYINNLVESNRIDE